MITKPTSEQLNEVKNVWKQCFPEEDPRYTDFFFRQYYKEENCYIKVVKGKIVSVLMRNPHAMMFNSRPLRISMIMGVATLPEYRKKGYMHELMKTVLDACEHTELITLIQTETPAMYEQFGFRTIYRRTEYKLDRKDVKRITNFGCAYEPAPIDMLKVYSAFIRRFNGFYARDLEYFVKYKKEIAALGGKLVAFYDGKNQIRGYAAMIPQGEALRVDELIYLDSMSLMKLVNACLYEKNTISLNVSDAEDLSKVFPNAQKKTVPSTMARLNDPALFGKMYNHRVTNVKEAFAIGSRPLNLNESA